MEQRINRSLVCRSRGVPLWRLIVFTLSAWVLAIPVWAGGGKPATKIYNVADTRNVDGGISRWIADIYNNNLWLYALLVVSVMALMGLILGHGMDRLMRHIGINLGRLDHHE